MTTLDLYHAARPHDPSTISSLVAALLMILVLGIPALLAEPSEVAPETWRGNSAGFTLAQ